MRLEYFPYYCGGKILTGFFQSDESDDYVIANSIEHQRKYQLKYEDREVYTGGNYYAPKNKNKFYELIEKLIYNYGPYTPTIGTILAVTNNKQLPQSEYLRDIGFQKIGSYNKYPQYQGNKDDILFNATCVLWNVDVHNVLMPKLKEFNSVKENKNESKKRIFKTT